MDNKQSEHNSCRLTNLVALIIITIITVLIYFNTFSYPFHFDDFRNIVENKNIEKISSFLSTGGTRYIGELSFALNYYFGGLNVFGYHLVNTTIHLINGFLIWSLVRLTFRTPAMEGSSTNPSLNSIIARKRLINPTLRESC